MATDTAGEVTPRVLHPWVAEGQKRIRFGISIFPQCAEWGDFFDIVKRIEALGYDSYWTNNPPAALADCCT